jgi:8-amino-7-oxononanoate synthase
MTPLDFTSSSYLGYRHGHAELPPWRELTTGRPAVLAEPRQAGRLAAELARRTGRAGGLLATSTLHAFVDVWSALGAEPVAALLDAAAYPIGRLALRAAAVAEQAVTVGHFDPDRVAEAVAALPVGPRPVLLVDGLCPDCGRLAPLPDLLAALQPRRGIVLVDDTQALGLVGVRPRPGAPYGDGGGGTAARLAVPAGARLVVVASAAKALGAPLAVVAGPARLVNRIREHGPARTHAGAPSAAARAALHSALARDGTEGVARRLWLARLVRELRRLLHERGIPRVGGRLGPTQVVPLTTPTAAAGVLDGMRRAGVRAVAVHRRCGPGAGIAFLLTARHTPDDLARAADALATVLARVRSAGALATVWPADPLPTVPARVRLTNSLATAVAR